MNTNAFWNITCILIMLGVLIVGVISLEKSRQRTNTHEGSALSHQPSLLTNNIDESVQKIVRGLNVNQKPQNGANEEIRQLAEILKLKLEAESQKEPPGPISLARKELKPGEVRRYCNRWQREVVLQPGPFPSLVTLTICEWTIISKESKIFPCSQLCIHNFILSGFPLMNRIDNGEIKNNKQLEGEWASWKSVLTDYAPYQENERSG